MIVVAPLRGAAATTSTVKWPKQAIKWYHFLFPKEAKSQGKRVVISLKAIKIVIIIFRAVITYRMFLFFFVGLGLFKYDNAYNNTSSDPN